MEIIYSPESIKKLKKIPPSDLKKVKKKIDLIKANPICGKLLKGDFQGLYSIRAWPLRIIYSFDKKRQTVFIVTVDYRGSVYKN